MVTSLFDTQVPADERVALFGGSGRVRVWNLLFDPKAPFRAVLACELDPGASVGTHVQEQFPELVIALSGSATVAVNGLSRAVTAGDVVELPLGHSLALANASKDELFRYLIVKAGD